MHANLGPVKLRRPFMTYVPDGGGRLRGHLSSTSWKIFFRFCEFLFHEFIYASDPPSKFLDYKPWSEYAYFRS